MSRQPKYATVCAALPKLGLDPERKTIIEAVQREVRAAKPRDMDGETARVVDLLSQASTAMGRVLKIEKESAGGQPYAASYARTYAELREVKDVVSKWLSDVNLLVEVFEALMVDQMEVEGVASQRLVSGGSVSTSPEPYPSVKDKEALRVWCIEQGLERSMHLWPSTLASLVKERLLNGDPEPPGVECYTKMTVRLNRG